MGDPSLCTVLKLFKRLIISPFGFLNSGVAVTHFRKEGICYVAKLSSCFVRQEIEQISPSMQWQFQNRSILSLKKQLYLFNNGEFLISFLKPFLQFMKSSDHHSRQTYAVVVAWQRRGNEVRKSIILQTV